MFIILQLINIEEIKEEAILKTRKYELLMEQKKKSKMTLVLLEENKEFKELLLKYKKKNY